MLKFVEKVDDGHCNVIIFQNLKQMSGVDLIGLNRNSLMFFFFFLIFNLCFLLCFLGLDGLYLFTVKSCSFFLKLELIISLKTWNWGTTKSRGEAEEKIGRVKTKNFNI